MTILNIKHPALKRFYEKDDSTKVPSKQRNKIRKILAFLDNIDEPKGIDLPNFGLHQLEGSRKDQWAVKVSRNWRITFRFVEGHVRDVNLIDYH